MEILLLILGVFILLVLCVNIKVSREIYLSRESTKNERLRSYFFVWLLPVLGVLLVPKTILPKLHSKNEGSGIFGGGGDSSGGDCG